MKHILHTDEFECSNQIRKYAHLCMVRHSFLFSVCRSRNHVFVRCLSCVTVSSLGSEVSTTHPTAGPQGSYQEGAGGKGDRVGVFHSRTPLRCGQLSSLGGEGRQAAVATKAHAPKAVGKRCLVGGRCVTRECF